MLLEDSIIEDSLLSTSSAGESAPQKTSLTHGFKQAFLDTRPIFVGFVPFAMTLGVLMVHAGYPWYVPVLMSLAITAGASQFATFPLILAGAPLWEIALTTFVVNARHIFYGLSMLNKYPKMPFWMRNYCYLSLTDEVYAILSSRPYPLTPSYTLGVSFFCHFYWVFCTLLGAVSGQFFEFNMAALEFSSIALFWVLTIERYRHSTERWPFLLALSVCTFAWFIWDRSFLLFALLTCVTLLWSKERIWKRQSA